MDLLIASFTLNLGALGDQFGLGTAGVNYRCRILDDLGPQMEPQRVSKWSQHLYKIDVNFNQTTVCFSLIFY